MSKTFSPREEERIVHAFTEMDAVALQIIYTGSNVDRFAEDLRELIERAYEGKRGNLK